jgi:hypothetical protein
MQKTASDNPFLKREAVILQVVRFSGGQRAGKRGMLELRLDYLDKICI